MNQKLTSTIAEQILLGTAVGDALGVPVEFLSRQKIQQNPVTDMREFGTHQQPKGTWSDDSSMLFCTAESLSKSFDLQDIANNFVRWYTESFWTPHGEIFDIGNATVTAILLIKNGLPLTETGGTSERSNGNGSLMRILPMVLEVQHLPISERFQVISKVSAITHAHFRSCWACFLYIEYALKLINGLDKFEAYAEWKTEIREFISENTKANLNFDSSEITLFDRLLVQNIDELPIEEISGSGYVLHTLEASIWCLLTSENYAEAVLKAVNLGEDTDTTGAVTGGLAGIYYGVENMPTKWLNILVRKADIEVLAHRLMQAYAV